MTEMKELKYIKKCGLKDMQIKQLEVKVDELEKKIAELKERNEAQGETIAFYLIDHEEKAKRIAELERDKADLIYIRNANAKCMCEDKEYKEKAVALLKRVVEWADWQSGSKCPSFQDIEKDIKAFLEE